MTFPPSVEILVVGAGMAGLTAAAHLARQGREVLVVDKGHKCGGRMATRHMEGANLDHGATFLASVGGPFDEAMAEWEAAGVLRRWPHPFLDDPIWRGAPWMRAVPEYIARNLDIRTGTRVHSLTRSGPAWRVDIGEDRSLESRAVVLTPPVPQALALLDEGMVEVAPRVRARLETLDYERCLALLAIVDGPTKVPEPGLYEPGAGPIARIIDNLAKGVSPVSAVTILSDDPFSRSHWDDPREKVADRLLAEAAPWLGGRVLDSRIHGWRYCRPKRTWPEPAMLLEGEPPLVLAGDAFGGPDVAGAHRSGLAAAAMIGNINDCK